MENSQALESLPFVRDYLRIGRELYYARYDPTQCDFTYRPRNLSVCVCDNYGRRRSIYRKLLVLVW